MEAEDAAQDVIIACIGQIEEKVNTFFEWKWKATVSAALHLDHDRDFPGRYAAQQAVLDPHGRWRTRRLLIDPPAHRSVCCTRLPFCVLCIPRSFDGSARDKRKKKQERI